MGLPLAQLWEEALLDPCPDPQTALPARPSLRVCLPSSLTSILQAQPLPLFPTLLASGEGLSRSSPRQVPPDLQLTLLFRQPLSSRSLPEL